jgi:hypothetical protein
VENTTRTHILPYLIAFALALTAVAPVQAVAKKPSTPVEDDGGSLAESQIEARRRAASKDLAIEPLVDANAVGPRPAAAQVYDIAIVPFKNTVNKHKAGLVHDKTREYFTKLGFKVAPKSQVDAIIKELGLLSTEAVMLQDCDAIARAVGARWLVFGTIKLTRTDTGFSPAGSVVSAAQAVTGGLLAVSSLPLVVGGLAVSGVAGFTAHASTDIEARVYDKKVEKIIWVGTESYTAKKHFMAVFANKKQLQEQALERGLKKLFDPVAKRLQPSGGKTNVD